MTDRGAPWAPVEAGAATPSRRLPVDRAAAGLRIRLRRSSNPVIAALDGGGDILQRRGRDVLVGAAVLIVPMVVLNLVVTVLAFDRVDAAGPLLPGFGDDASTGIEQVSFLLAAVMASATAALVGVFAAAILLGERFAQPVRLGEAMSSTVRRLPVVAVAWVVGHWWLVPLDAFAVGGGSEDLSPRLLLVVPVAAFVTPLLLYVGPVIVAEHAGPVRAVRRSWRLARMRYGASLGFVVASTLLGGLLLAGVASLPALLSSTGFLTFGSYAWLANGIAAQIGVLVVVPLVALATAQMYLEVRLDAEGMDLMLDADAAFGPGAP